MPYKPERQIMSESLIEMNNGQAYFNFTEIAKIVGCGVHTVPRLLYNAGISVKKVGPSKRVSAVEIAELMAQKRTSPVD